ncbi:glutamine synthetase family protein [Cryptosporangium arvum]|uniref:Glutamine synthetase n=1 Tax=Cryptosporangium arvum DSM 44712 TaxID=927661 RepID=A0A010YX70_9ACTN|nr:glutamine synthetase family protein [Cryptosporangium arvum]EXG79743.1 glutamine synthetase [Cryptosporangium arvum DSM 44712]
MALSTMSPPAIPTPEELWARAAEELANAGVIGVTIVWADNNGIPRSQIVPIDQLASCSRYGVGLTSLFAVLDSHDGTTFSHQDLSTPSGEVRLVPVIDRLVRLKGQPAFAWAPGRQLGADGLPTPYDQRSVLERQVERAQDAGIAVRAGYELEFYLCKDAELTPAHRGPAYSPTALLRVDEFVAQLLSDLNADGVPVGQLHAEHGQSRLKVTITATDPVSAADRQMLARQTIHAAARAQGLRASFAPVVDVAGIGNVWRLHSSPWRRNKNLLMNGDGPHGLSEEGAGYLAGLLRDLPAIAAVSAPSVPSLTRLRPSAFAGAYAFWGIGNREAPLRFLPSTSMLGPSHANIELTPSDASANPYLALAVVIGAGLAGIEEKLELPEPIQEDVGTWPEERRSSQNIRRLPISTDEQLGALQENPRIAAVLGPELAGAFAAVRRSDHLWAQDRSIEDVIDGHRWLY